MRFLQALVIVAISLSANTVSAGTAEGKVKFLQPHGSEDASKSVVMFSVGPHEGKPVCSTEGDDWDIDLTNDAGRAMYSLLLIAASQGRTVKVEGYGDCIAWGDRETAKWIWVVFDDQTSSD